jgi:hypothetical protein
MFVSAMASNARSADVGLLSGKATARMEALRAEDFHNLLAGGSLTTEVAGYSDESDPDVVVRWEIVDGGGPAGSRSIRVEAIALGQLGGRPTSVRLTTLRSR